MIERPQLTPAALTIFLDEGQGGWFVSPEGAEMRDWEIFPDERGEFA
jgi:hypothetical protein